MDQATYDSIPETIELRELRFNIVVPGRRTKVLTIVTTLSDADEFTKEDIAELYGFRWHVELDIRSIKQNLNLSHLRCKSPAMIRTEFRTTLLAYNLIRSVSAWMHGRSACGCETSRDQLHRHVPVRVSGMDAVEPGPRPRRRNGTLLP